MNKLDYEELEKEFMWIRKFQACPDTKQYVKCYFEELENDLTTWKFVEESPKGKFPTKYKVTYSMPMYVAKDRLITDWSASLIFIINQNSNGNKYKIEIDGGEFPEGSIPFNNYISKYWVSPASIFSYDSFCQKTEKHLWYYIMLTGCLLNQDSIANSNDINEEHRHLNSEAFRFWKYDRNEAPITDIKWPYHLGEVTVKLPTCEEVLLSDFDISRVTAHELIMGFIEVEMLSYTKGEYGYPVYGIVGKDGLLILEEDSDNTLSALGFVDGDIIKIVCRGCTC